MYDKILGIDVAKATLDVALLPVQVPTAGHAEQPCCRQVPNTPEGFAELQTWLNAQHVTNVLACFEATSTYGEAVAAALVAAGHRVVRANPYQINQYANSELLRNRTDRQMAVVIARFARDRQARLPLWTPPDPALHTLQDLSRHAEDLQTLLVQVGNRLERTGHCPEVVASLTKLVEQLTAERAQILDQLRAWLRTHPRLTRQIVLLRTIPGIAEKSAIALLAELGDVTRFHSTRQAAAYTGVTPATTTSGTSVATPAHFSPHGNRRLKKALFYPALVAIRHDPRLHAYYQRLRKAGKSKMAAVGAVMHKLLKIAVAILRTDTAYDLYLNPELPLTNE